MSYVICVYSVHLFSRGRVVKHVAWLDKVRKNQDD